MIYFITFGSHDNYIEASKRLINQAKKINIFDTIKLYTVDDLKQDNFWKLHHEFITNNSRGFGYWIWKPYLIKKTIDQMKNNDILLYLDSGCEIDIHEKEYLLECIDIVKRDYIVGTLGLTNVEESCKMDLLLKLDMNYDKYLKTRMHQAGANLILVCDKTQKLINEWFDLSSDYHLINDLPSINTNVKEFKEHRHDQSIYCLLTKKYNLYSEMNLGKHCIKCIRNRSGTSLL